MNNQSIKKSVALLAALLLAFSGAVQAGEPFRFGTAVRMAERVPPALSDDLCDMAYIARFADRKEVDSFCAFVCERL